MIKIKGAQRTRFAKLYRQVLREKHLTSSQVAERIGLDKRSVYNTASLSNTKAITLKRVMRVLEGLPLTKSQLNALVYQIIHGKSSKSAKYNNKNKRLNQAAKAKLNGLSATKAARKYHVGVSTIYKYAKRMKKNHASIKRDSSQKHPQQLSLQPINENRSISGDNIKNHLMERSVIKKALKHWDHGMVVLYKPIHNHRPSPLAEDIKNHMANEQMNMRTLTYRTGLNHKRIHEFFNGKRQVLPRLTIFRLALGLNLKAHKLLQMNHADIQISKSIVSGNHHSAKQNEQEPSHTLSSRLIDIIKKLDDNDVKLILPIAKRLLESEK